MGAEDQQPPAPGKQRSRGVLASWAAGKGTWAISLVALVCGVAILLVATHLGSPFGRSSTASLVGGTPTPGAGTPSARGATPSGGLVTPSASGATPSASAATPTPSARPSSPASAAPPPTQNLPSLTFPIRAAFYYPWFPEAWNQQGMNPFTHYQPSLGFYATTQATVTQQVQAMQYGHIQAGIASWWGQGSATDGRISMLLSVAAATGFKWSLYYEPEGQGDPSVAQIASDLSYIAARYAGQAGYLRVGGRPVLFVYADGADGCGMATRWKQANTLGFYVVLKVFSGYKTCADQPAGWHQYAPANAQDSQAGFSYTISPGFWKGTEAAPRLARDPAAWSNAVHAMVASRAPWQLVTTFDEWGEGTSVESATEWQSGSGYGLYLDALHAS